MDTNLKDINALPSANSADLAKLNVSLFKNLCSSNNKAVGIDELERLVKFDADVLSKTEAYRKMYIAVGKKEADKQVKQKLLPACSVAVLFNGMGKQVSHILGFTALGFTDIDDVENPEAVIQAVRADPHTLMAYITVSGHGLRIIYRYVREQAGAHIDSNSWRAAFQKGNGYYAALTEKEYDNQCSDYTHLCGLAHDEYVYLNREAEPFVITDDEIVHANFGPGSEGGKPRKEHPAGTCKESVEAVWPKVQKMLGKRNLLFQPGRHHDYVMNAAFLFNRFGVDLEELLEWGDEVWEDYDSKEREATIRSCYKKEDEHGTWKLTKKDLGAEGKILSLSAIAGWLKIHYELRYDLVTDLTYCRALGSQEWKTADTRTVCTMRRKMAEELASRVLKTDVQDVIWSDIAVAVHPVRDYLQALPKWDGKDRVAELTSYVTVVPTQPGQTAEDAQQLFHWAAHKWLLGNVGMWLRDDTVNHEMLILVGPQGIYKTTFFRWLLPPQLRHLYLENNHNTFSTKDDQIALGENCLMEVEEFNITHPREIGALKSSLTAMTIKERRPYARQREEKHRLAGICGTCNEQNFLADETGNRRFLCFMVSSVKMPSEWGIDYDQLYAQLRDEFLSGRIRYWFNSEEEQRMALQNEAFRLVSDEEMLVGAFFRKPLPSEPGELMNAAMMVRYINGGRMGYGLSSKKVGSIMKRMGIAVEHKSSGNFYRVVKVPYNQQQAEIEHGSVESKPENQQPKEADLPF